MVHPRLSGTVLVRTLAPLLVLALVASVSQASPARALGEELELVGTYGGPGHAEMYPSGLEVAADGSVIIADTGNHQVAKYDAAGTPVWRVGSFGNERLEFEHPRDVGIDSQGNVFVADTGNARIVKLDPTGAWITSWKGPDGDRMGTPMGVTVTDDLVYVADAGGQRIRIFSVTGVQSRVLSSDGDCVFSNVRDADADAQGNVYVANYTKNDILKLSPSGECLTKWGTKGEGVGQFKNPYGVRVATDPVLGTQAVYVADSNNYRLQEFLTDGTYVAQVGERGTPVVPGTFYGLRRLAVAPDGDLWGADMWGWRIERWDRTASGYTYAQTIGAVPPPLAYSAVFNEVRGLDFDAEGTIFAVDTVNERIVRMTKDGVIIGACGERGWGPGEFNWPRGLAVDDATGDVWLADTKQSRLQIVRPDCTDGVIVGSAGSGLRQFAWPAAVAIRQTDRIAFVADMDNDRVVAYDVRTRLPLGTYDALDDPSGIDVDPVTGHVLVADTGNNRIVELTANAAGSFSFVRALTANLRAPQGVAADTKGHVFVADTLNNRLVVFSPDGSVAEIVTDPIGFDEPAEVAVDPLGRVMVADTLNDRIQVYAYPSDPREVGALRVLAEPEPIAFTFTPDGRIVYGERASGEIHVRSADGLRDTLVWRIGGVAAKGQGGVLGVAVHPNYPTVRAIYAAVTRMVDGDVKLQIVRIKVGADDRGTALRVIYKTKAAFSRIGGGLQFGPDDALYLSVGDIGSAALSQRTSDPHGKILRMNPDATIPPDNPVADSRMFARGLRDPVGLAFEPLTGVLWNTDSAASCNDEVNRVVAGANLGWGRSSSCATPPAAPLNSNQSGTGAVLPEYWWGAPLGIRGLAFCWECGLGPAVEGSILVGAANTNEIRALSVDAERDDVQSESTIYTHGQAVLSLESAPDGTVYFSDATGIWRLETT